MSSITRSHRQGSAGTVLSGERLSMSRSGVYSQDTFVAILEEAGLTARWRGISENGKFLMVLASHPPGRL